MNIKNNLYYIYQDSIHKLSDVFAAIGLMFIVMVLLLPLPTWGLDISLAISIALSIVILMLVLFTEKATNLSTFPTILLISTIFRLALNIASTRTILTNGHQGIKSAGEVIYAFGNFVMSGNYIIGIIVFIILITINFVVITKGSGRIAEVSARFALDAMPGKQMSIDADVSSGLMNEKDARLKRRELEEEASFYGAMDGAAKFVRGDAIAGLIITIINLVAGIMIGVFQQHLSLNQALESYTVLTVGDGLVSQMPALLVSIAAGLLISKSNTDGSMQNVFARQFGAYPVAIGMSGIMLCSLIVLPGIPKAIFTVVGGIIGYLSYRLSQNITRKKAEDEQTAISKSREESFSIPKLDDIRIELGQNLLWMVDASKGNALDESIQNIRNNIGKEFGFNIPLIRIKNNPAIGKHNYIILIKDVIATKWTIAPDKLLIIGNNISAFNGIETHEPVFKAPAKWIDKSLHTQALSNGCMIADSTTIISTHINQTILDNLSDLLSYTETDNILNQLDNAYTKLLGEIAPAQITYGNIQYILQSLLKERVGIKDIGTIIVSIAEALHSTKNIEKIIEHVRFKLSKQICGSLLSDNNSIAVIMISSEWENIFRQNQYEDKIAVSPEQMSNFTKRIGELVNKSGDTMPALVTSKDLRTKVRDLINPLNYNITVLSRHELGSKFDINIVGQI